MSTDINDKHSITAQEKPAGRSLMPMGTIGAIVVLLAAAGIFFSTFPSKSGGAMEFDSQNWQSEKCCRAKMLDSLQQKYQLTGMDKEQLTAILGKPDQETDSQWQYTLPDNHSFTLTWADGKVSNEAVQ